LVCFFWAGGARGRAPRHKVYVGAAKLPLPPVIEEVWRADRLRHAAQTLKIEYIFIRETRGIIHHIRLLYIN
jgi:hypothetical protein